MQVLKPMLKDRGLKNSVDFYVEPSVMFLLSIALTIPISSTTFLVRERSVKWNW